MQNDANRCFRIDTRKAYAVLLIRFSAKLLLVTGGCFLMVRTALYDVRLLLAVVPAFMLSAAAVLFPLRFGMLRFFWNRETEKNASLNDIAAFFSPGLFGAAVKNGLLFRLFDGLCFLTFFLPCLSLLALLWYNISRLSPLVLCAACFFAFWLLFFSASAAFFKMKKLTFLSAYLFVLSPEKQAGVCLVQSAEILNGRTAAVTAVKRKNFFSRACCLLVFPAGPMARRCAERNSRLAGKLLKERK